MQRWWWWGLQQQHQLVQSSIRRIFGRTAPLTGTSPSFVESKILSPLLESHQSTASHSHLKSFPLRELILPSGVRVHQLGAQHLVLERNQRLNTNSSTDDSNSNHSSSSPHVEFTAIDLNSGRHAHIHGAWHVACGRNRVLWLSENRRTIHEWQSTDETAGDVFKQSELAGKVTAIRQAMDSSFALLDDGQVFGRGWNFDGQLALADTARTYDHFVQLPLPSPVERLFTGCDHVVAITKDNTSLLCWGNNEYGQCQPEDPRDQLTTPVVYRSQDLPFGISSIRDIVGGSTYTAVLTGSELWVQGDHPVLRDPSSTERKQPRTFQRVALAPLANSTRNHVQSYRESLSNMEISGCWERLCVVDKDRGRLWLSGFMRKENDSAVQTVLGQWFAMKGQRIQRVLTAGSNVLLATVPDSENAR